MDRNASEFFAERPGPKEPGTQSSATVAGQSGSSDSQQSLVESDLNGLEQELSREEYIDSRTMGDEMIDSTEGFDEDVDGLSEESIETREIGEYIDPDDDSWNPTAADDANDVQHLGDFIDPDADPATYVGSQGPEEYQSLSE